MPLVNLPQKILYPSRTLPYHIWASSSTTADENMVTANDEYHMIGNIIWDGQGTKSLSKIHLVFTGTVSGGTILTVGTQNISSTTAPIRGDGSFTHSGTVTTPTAGVVSTTLGTNPSLASGSFICVVAKIDTSNATWKLKMFPVGATGAMPWTTKYSASSYSALANIPNVLFESTDGTYGTFEHGSFLGGDPSTITMTNASTPKERGVTFTVPFKCQMDGVWFRGRFGNDTVNGTGNINVYSNVLAGVVGDIVTIQQYTVPRNKFVQQQNSTRGAFVPLYVEHTLVPGTVYGVALEATGTGNIYIEEVDLGNAAYRAGLPGGSSYYSISRDSASNTFTTNTQKHHAMGIIISELDDGTGSGGGLTAGRSIPLIV